MRALMAEASQRELRRDENGDAMVPDCLID
jgi:hypothetical protein